MVVAGMCTPVRPTTAEVCSLAELPRLLPPLPLLLLRPPLLLLLLLSVPPSTHTPLG